jgi:hypothetical protein
VRHGDPRPTYPASLHAGAADSAPLRDGDASPADASSLHAGSTDAAAVRDGDACPADAAAVRDGHARPADAASVRDGHAGPADAASLRDGDPRALRDADSASPGHACAVRPDADALHARSADRCGEAEGHEEADAEAEEGDEEADAEAKEGDEEAGAEEARVSACGSAFRDLCLTKLLFTFPLPIHDRVDSSSSSWTLTHRQNAKESESKTANHSHEKRRSSPQNDSTHKPLNRSEKRNIAEAPFCQQNGDRSLIFVCLVRLFRVFEPKSISETHLQRNGACADLGTDCNKEKDDARMRPFFFSLARFFSTGG